MVGNHDFHPFQNWFGLGFQECISSKNRQLHLPQKAPVEMPLLHMFLVFNTCIPMAREEWPPKSWRWRWRSGVSKNNPTEETWWSLGLHDTTIYTLVDLLKLFYTVHGKNSSALRFFKISFRISLNHGEIDLTSTRFKRRRCLPPFWGWKSFASTIGIPQLSLVHPGNGFNWQVECEDPETWKRFRSKLALSLEVQPPYSSRSLSSKRNHHF